jgi:hypothetical protein
MAVFSLEAHLFKFASIHTYSTGGVPMVWGGRGAFYTDQSIQNLSIELTQAFVSLNYNHQSNGPLFLSLLLMLL